MQLEVISREPHTDVRGTPLLFVHGAWHGAWCWEEHFLDHFAQHGFSAHALSLRAHGQSDGRGNLRWTRIADYVADVARVAGELPQPPVVIGHSMGGLVVQKYLERHPAPAGVLLASVPPAGALGVTLRLARRYPAAFTRVHLTLSLWPLVSTPRRAHDLLFSGRLPDVEMLTYIRQLQDESYRAFLDMLLLNRPRPKRVSTPMLVLGAEEDQLFPVQEVEATARAYHTEAVIFPEMGHSMMLDVGWEAVADRIIEWLVERLSPAAA